MTDTPIEDYLDELLRRTHADARTTRRLLDEASDHLYAAASELEAEGTSRSEAEREAVRRFGPVRPIARASMRGSLLDLVLETMRAAVFLAGWGLAAVGISGIVALVMNLCMGDSFVGAVGVSPFSGGRSVDETAHDAVVLRVLAGLVGLLLLLVALAWRRYASARPVLPAGLIEALGAAAFAAGSAGLAIVSADQVSRNGSSGVGFALSGLVVAFPATVYFCVRAARALLPTVSRDRTDHGGASPTT